MLCYVVLILPNVVMWLPGERERESRADLAGCFEASMNEVDVKMAGRSTLLGVS